MSEIEAFDPTDAEHRTIGRGVFDEDTGPGSAMAHLYRGEIHRMTRWRERMGMVNRVVPAGELEATLEAELADIRKTPSTAVAIAKAMVNDVQETQGYRRYGRVEDFVGTMTMETETARRFREIRDEEGLDAALEWMHGTDKP